LFWPQESGALDFYAIALLMAIIRASL